MRRPTIRFVLITAALLVIICPGPAIRSQSDNEVDSRQRSRQDLAEACGELSKQVNTIKSPELQAAANKFLQAAERPDNSDQLTKAADSLEAAVTAARDRAVQQGKPFSEREGVKAIGRAVSAARSFVAQTSTKDKDTANKTKDDPANSNKSGNVEPPSPLLPAWIWQIAAGVAALGLLVVSGFLIMRLRRGYWDRFYHHVSRAVKANTAELMQRQDELVKHMNALAGQHRSGAARLESIEGELQALGRRARALSDGGGYQSNSNRQSVTDYSRPQPTPVEPEFPTSVDEYLNKMKRNSTVVKPDFQNGILVSDLDGRGELVLVRDTRLADDAQPLLLVPRVGQFQTKQEFHSYYERYYECQKPSAGNVWIIDPAVVSTVPGGWELREKGVLEVR